MSGNQTQRRTTGDSAGGASKRMQHRLGCGTAWVKKAVVADHTAVGAITIE
ncbi:hypothetical protein IE4771_PB00117 (plasmid) [Rhizobium etli bv. mimosae str. IE4771]|uniref:Uncharacterized protein n=1 Tax=Rhizobium etli bv. mimosae str. IE4771 TaxID=1432050 RepID=A0A060I3W7_RHIET|nr:hypothetical protein IE4771_PB00117 [Rhizobium sp. IE4771]